MNELYLIGTALFAAAAVLFYLGLPNRAGESPRFLRFELAPMLYPHHGVTCFRHNRDPFRITSIRIEAAKL